MFPPEIGIYSLIIATHTADGADRGAHTHTTHKAQACVKAIEIRVATRESPTPCPTRFSNLYGLRTWVKIVLPTGQNANSAVQ
jgi:hypothetical protein